MLFSYVDAKVDERSPCSNIEVHSNRLRPLSIVDITITSLWDILLERTHGIIPSTIEHYASSPIRSQRVYKQSKKRAYISKQILPSITLNHRPKNRFSIGRVIQYVTNANANASSKPTSPPNGASPARSAILPTYHGCDMPNTMPTMPRQKENTAAMPGGSSPGRSHCSTM